MTNLERVLDRVSLLSQQGTTGPDVTDCFDGLYREGLLAVPPSFDYPRVCVRVAGGVHRIVFDMEVTRGE